MKIWINKAQEDEKSEEYSNAVVFSMLNEKGNLGTNFEDIWRRFNLEQIDKIFEDLLVIGAAIFATDRRIPRRRLEGEYSLEYKYRDNWTRNIKINVPVLEFECWELAKNDLEEFLNFLTGDEWELDFRRTQYRYRNGKYSRRKYENQGQMINTKEFDCVSLFSGGLDSFCGALHLLEEQKNVFLVSCMEHKLLRKRVNELFDVIKEDYPDLNTEIYIFSTNPRKPQDVIDGFINKFVEDTSRSRSFLFMAVAIAVASVVKPKDGVYIPENGFIGINLPLTKSRLGSCSTRTTHVWALKRLNTILKLIGIDVPISNFYAHKTKGEIVEEFKDNITFRKCAGRTLSCSHPTHGRMAKTSPPINCGYCYPCMIRRASLNKINFDNTKYIEYFNDDYKLSMDMIEKYGNPYSGRAKDLIAVLQALHVYENNTDENYYKKALIKLGNLSLEEVMIFEVVCKKSLEELNDMMVNIAKANDIRLMDYIGIKQDV